MTEEFKEELKEDVEEALEKTEKIVNVVSKEGGDISEEISNLKKIIKDAMKKWDTNNDGVHQPKEIIVGILTSPKILVSFFFAVIGIYTSIVSIVSVMEGQINWIALMFGVVFIVGGIMIYYIIDNSFKTSKETMMKLAKDHNTEAKKWAREKQAYINQIDGLKEEKYQHLAIIGTKDGYIKELQKKLEEAQKN